MSEPPTSEPNPVEPPGPDRLGPRPLNRPPADPSAAAVFGRPTGVDGAFAPPPGGTLGGRNAFADLKVVPPTPESLVTAFGRPQGSTEGLQRPPGASRVAPGVVSIEVKGGEQAGTGSGVMIDSKGYIVTNDHVVTLAGQLTSGQQITVVFIDGHRVAAQVVGRDAKTDLAVIKVDVNNPTVLTLGNSDDLQVDGAVFAI